MYMLLVLAAAIICSAGVVTRGVQLSLNSYKVISMGTIYGAIGCLIVIAMSSVFGAGIGSIISGNVDIMSEAMAKNKEYAELLGISDLSDAELVAFYKKLYDSVIMIIPAMLIIWSAIIAYTECAIATRSFNKKGEARVLAPIREFSLSKTAVLGWLVISILAWVFVKGEVFSFAETINANIYLLFRAVFCLQGISVLAYIFHMKKWKRPLWVILTVIMLMTNVGTIILYVTGIIDALSNIKGRIGVTR